MAVVFTGEGQAKYGRDVQIALKSLNVIFENIFSVRKSTTMLPNVHNEQIADGVGFGKASFYRLWGSGCCPFITSDVGE